MNRRTFVRFVGATLGAGLAGCTQQGAGPGTTSLTEDAEQSPTGTPNWESASPSDLLPIPNDRWEQGSVSSAAFSNLGYVEGSQAEYTNSEELVVRVLIVVTMNDPPESQAEEFANHGWQVALPFRRFTFAAGTGTNQYEHPTPETPITMDRTPVPGTDGDVKELLALSPALSSEYIRVNDVASS